jgi:hypothetical protein
MKDLLDDLITTAQAADLLGFADTARPMGNVARYLRRYAIPTYRRGRRILVSRRALLEEMANESERQDRARSKRAADRHKATRS